MSNSKNKLQVNQVIENLQSRIIWIPKNGRILIYSLGNTWPVKVQNNFVKELLSNLTNKAEQEKADLIFGLGFSLPDKSNNHQLTDHFKNTKFTFLAENEHFILIQGGVLTSVTKQMVFNGEDKRSIYAFVKNIKNGIENIELEKNKIPLLLLVCGENSIFNASNRKPTKVGEELITAMQKLSFEWAIYNPSHTPYRGRVGPTIPPRHRYLVQQECIKWVLAGNNSDYCKNKSPLLANLLNYYSNKSKKEKELKRKQLFNNESDWANAWYSIVDY